MFNASKIKTNLYGVVGFRQPFNPTYAILDVDNSSSASDQWVSENQHCKVEFLYDTQDYSGLSDAEFNEALKNLQEDAIVNTCSRVFNKPDYIDRQVFIRTHKIGLIRKIYRMVLFVLKSAYQMKKI